MPNACEVCTNLVHAARFELDFYEVIAFVMLLDAVMRDGFLCVFVILADEHLAALGAIGAQKRFVDGTAVFFEVAFDERKVEFVHNMFANHAGEVAERVAVERCNNHARRFLVKAVGNRWLKVETFVFAPFPKVFYEAFAGARAATWLACKSRGFVDYDIIFGLHDKVELVRAPMRLFLGARKGARGAPLKMVRKQSNYI